MNINDFDNIQLPLIIAAIIVICFSLVIAIWATILELQIFFKYRSNNKKHLGGGRTAKQVAEEMLAKLGYTDIKVARTSYLWLIFFRNWGNRYSPRRKTIFLYNNIINNDTVTAVALAMQKVGLVVLHKEGNKQMAFRAKWEFWTRMSPNLFLPIVSIGLIIDLLLSGWSTEANLFGVVTLVFTIIAFIYTAIAFYSLYLIIPTERKAGEIALTIIENNNLVPANHIADIVAMFRVYVLKYICDFILAILQLLLDILRIAIAITEKKD